MGDKWLNDLMICYTKKELFGNFSNEKINKIFEEMNTLEVSYSIPSILQNKTI